MNIKVETLFTKNSKGFEANNNKVLNQVFGSNYSENFVVSTLKVEEIQIKSTENNSFELSLLDIVSDISKISAIHVFCNQEINTPTDYAIPIKFTTQIDDLFLVATQFSLINCENLVFNVMKFHTLQIPTNKNALFTLIVALK